MNFKDRYKYNPKSDLLGKGGFARVYKATDTLLDRDVAVKIFNTSENGHYTVLEEIKKVIKLEHPNLLRYYDVAILENTNAFGENETLQVGIMELANAGDLKQFSQENPNSNLLYDLLQQVLNGLGFLHLKGIIHRDLKPQNILLVKDNDGKLTAKISDFGISKNTDSNTNSASMTIGTIEYMAPEQFSPNKYGVNGKIGTNLDLWSFGIMVHELITNKPPFGQRNGNTTAEQIMSSILSAELPEEIDTIKEPYKTVIKKCLVSDANLRIKNASELIQYFENEESSKEEQVTQILSKPKITTINSSDDLETKTFETTQNDETKIIGQNPSIGNSISNNLPEENGDLAPNEKSKKSNLIIGVLACLFVGVAIFTGYKFFLGTVSNEKFYSSIEEKFKNKQYDEVLIALKDSVDLKSNTISKLAIQYYTNSILAKGDTNNAIPYISKSLELGINENAYTLGEIYYKEQNYAKAKPIFEVSINDARSETMLGNMYFMELGVDKNFETAVKYYESAAKKGNSTAMYALGLSYLNGAGVSQNIVEAKKWFEKVISKNDNIYAILNIAHIYRTGHINGIAIDYIKYKVIIEKLAAMKVPKAITKLGEIYRDGYGVSQNDSTANAYFVEAIKLGDGEAMSNYADQYYNGSGVEKNIEKCIYWNEEAIKKNDIWGQANMMILYKGGEGVKKDYGKAKKILDDLKEIAINTQDYSLLSSVTWSYINDKDYDLAIELTKKIKSSDYFYILGHMFVKGYGVQKSLIECKKLMEKGADLGNRQCMRYLASIYYYEDGDIKQAKYYYNLACKNGNNNACDELKKLK